MYTVLCLPMGWRSSEIHCFQWEKIMRSRKPRSGSVPMVEALEGRQMMSAAPVIWHGEFNNKLPGFGTYTFTMASSESDPAPFKWDYSTIVRRHNGKYFGGWFWVT